MSVTPKGHRRWVSTYYPGLDGLRGVAILMVFLRHYAVLVYPAKVFYAGWVGVDLFFVLSGFLITGILYDGRGLPSFYRNFYVRRALRVLPLLYALFFLALVLRTVGLVYFHYDLLSYAFFFGNVLLYVVDWSKHNPTIISFTLHGHVFKLSIGYLWSLCVEEQFYLFWPVVILRIADRKRLMRLCAVLIVMVLFLRIFLFAFGPSRLLADLGIYELTFTRMDTLLVGSWIALWLRGRLLTREGLRRLAFGVGGSCLSVLLLGVGLTIGRWPTVSSNPFLSTVGYTLVAVVGGSLLLLTLDQELPLTKWLLHPWVTGLGTISYGFYVLHGIPLPVVTYVLLKLSLGMRAVVVAVLFLVVAGLSVVSFLYFEVPYLRLKAVYAPRRPQAVRLPEQSGI